ncbi:hypothetical protein FRC08_008542 [Ceratobasidium sp. 394]|nr:hypothetical protein FRC08_008542 [Ceratobasidium sp. 394]KAG9083213.1 hypothetical protein FS749_006215 [Ceratobasidium sp. UAMH 11750]
MALNPAICYEWIDQNWSPEDATNARAVVKQHMLRCLEEQQSEHREVAIPAKLTPGPAEMATRRSNKGYSTLLAAGIDMHPASKANLPVQSDSRPFNSPPELPPSSVPFNTSSLGITSNALHQVQTSQRPMPNKELNPATVELEHRKFEEEPVIPAEDMDGISPFDYWLLCTTIS